TTPMHYHSLPPTPTYHLSLLFFTCSRPHRDLPSFPTRRSSDLPPASRAASARSRRRCATSRVPHSRARGRASRSPRRRGTAARRSEEHTSELQSPCNLVCRLLLEKKKKKKILMSHIS